MERKETKDELVVESLATLFQLYRESELNKPNRYRALHVSLHALSEVENQDWEQRLKRLYYACGCSEGTAVALLATGAYLVWFSVESALTLTSGIAALLIFLFGGTIGRNFGLMQAKRRLRKSTLQLRDLLLEKEPDASQEWPALESDSIKCGNP